MIILAQYVIGLIHPWERNFVEGKRILHANYIIKFVKNVSESGPSNSMKFSTLSYKLQIKKVIRNCHQVTDAHLTDHNNAKLFTKLT